MTIGVDLRTLQIGHQYRGVGEVIKRTLNGMFALAIAEATPPTFKFYQYDDPIDPLQFLELPAGLQHETVVVGPPPIPAGGRSTQEVLKATWRSLAQSPAPRVTGCDVFLQYDYALGVPSGTKTVLIEHDLIPLIFWHEYFESPWLHVKHKAARTTLRTLLTNTEFKRTLRSSLNAAKLIVCVSDSTKRDVQKYFGVPDKKLKTIRLGVSQKIVKTNAKVDSTKLPSKPYLLFVGGIDGKRRAVNDLIAAYNNLKADGHDIQLALVGENFQAADQIPIEHVRNEVKASSYREDILLLGYIDDVTKQKLYQQALAFVYPTRYEGFGIPVLEAMLMDCPVIAYNNSSIPEVGGQHVLYAKGWETIKQQVERLMKLSPAERQTLTNEAHKHAQTFSWDMTSRQLYDELKQIAS